jgi:hypothetical protein
MIGFNMQILLCRVLIWEVRAFVLYGIAAIANMVKRALLLTIRRKQLFKSNQLISVG